MKYLLSSLSILGALAFFALAAGCTTTTTRTESFLTSAGFKTKMPATAKQQQHFKTLTPYKLMTMHRHGKAYYVYADPAQNQLYIGNQAQYQQYQQIRQANKLALEQTYSEAMGDWGVWEPFGD